MRQIIIFIKWHLSRPFNIHRAVSSLSGRPVASWLVHLTLEWVVWVQALTAGDIVLCFWARHLTLIVPLPTKEYKWVPVNCWGKPNKLLPSGQWWTSIQSRESAPSCCMLQKLRSALNQQLWATHGGGRKGLRWCGFGLFLVQFCGNFYFNSQYCGFKTLSSLQLLQPFGHSFRWKKSACGDDTR